VERGHDPRRLELVAFGGAGPLHACEVAEVLGIRRIRVPAATGMLSALGIAGGDRRLDAVRGVVAPLAELRARDLQRLGPRVVGTRAGRSESWCDLRYRGQAFELTVAAAPFATLAARFHAAHQRRFGFDDRGAAIELVAVRSVRVQPGPALRRAGGAARREVAGPAAVPLEGATLWVAAGWVARARPDASWLVSR
jgi:N-methylhydantoinase A